MWGGKTTGNGVTNFEIVFRGVKLVSSSYTSLASQ